MVTLYRTYNYRLRFDVDKPEQADELSQQLVAAKRSPSEMMAFIEQVFRDDLARAHPSLRQACEIAVRQDERSLFKRIDSVAPAIRYLIRYGRGLSQDDLDRFARQAKSTLEHYLVWKLTPSGHYRRTQFYKMIQCDPSFWESTLLLDVTSSLKDKRQHNRLLYVALSLAQSIEEFEAVAARAPLNAEVRYECYRRILKLVG